MNNQTARRGATLPCGAKSAPKYPFQGEIQIGVFHDDLSVLTTQFQGHAPEIPSTNRSDLASNSGRTGKRNELHIPMGMRTDMANLSGSSDGVVSPNSRRPSPAT